MGFNIRKPLARPLLKLLHTSRPVCATLPYVSDVNECLMFPCQNGATCNNLEGSYECVCAEGWTGVNCQIGKSLSFLKTYSFSLKVVSLSVYFMTNLSMQLFYTGRCYKTDLDIIWSYCGPLIFLPS